VLFNRLWAWFQRSTIFRLPQFGFRPKSSTVDAVFVLLGIVRHHLLIAKTPCHVAFVDITKAFPSVNRKQLFDRLAYGRTRNEMVLFLTYIFLLFEDIFYFYKASLCLYYRLRDLGVPVGLINGVTGFYDTYMSRLRIGTRLTAAYLVSTGLLEGTMRVQWCIS
jgi:hypothetical protein